MTHLELEEHIARLIVGTLLILFIILLIGLGFGIGPIITSLTVSGLIVLSISMIVLLAIGYWVGKWIVG